MAASTYANLDAARDFARLAIVRALNGGDRPSEVGQAAEKYGADHRVTRVLKAAMTAGTTTDAAWGGPLGEYTSMWSAFVELTRPYSVLAQLPLRQVPLGVRVPLEVGGASGYWVGEAAPKPLSSSGLDTVLLGPLKLCAVCVLTQELLRMAPAQAESIVTNMLARAVADVANSYFLSDQPEVAGVSPPGILSGVTTLTATADAIHDLSLLVESFAGSFETAAWLMRPGTAVELALLGARNASSTFIDLTAKGGSLFGCPCMTSTAIGQDSSGGGDILLVDCGQILLGAGAVEIVSARHASLEFLSNPTNNSSTATSTSQVSLFQTNAVAIKVARAINWKVVTPDAVVALTGCDYSGT